MVKKAKTSSGVKGPNSALTEFLRSEGITDAFRQRRARQSSNAASTDDTSVSAPDSGIEDQDEESNNISIISSRSRIDSDEEEKAIRRAGRVKRRAARNSGIPDSSDNDSDDENDSDYSDGNFSQNRGFKNFGEEDTCVDCGNTFNLTVYSRFIKEKKGYICDSCHELLKEREKNNRRNQQNARKKRKKLAEALLNKTSVKLPTLQDICIKKITENINFVEALGDIGQLNLNKISKILSKNRSLNDSTMLLFLSPDSKTLQFWDCSNIDSGSFNKIASFCPNIERLTLFMCGQFHNDNLKYYSTNLPNLKELCLNGPFLISDSVWQEYFEGGGSQLNSFEIRNTHRFGNDSLICLLENCGANLTSLKLSRLDGLDSAPVYELIPHYLKPMTLKTLEISYPHAENLITDDLIINILSICGESLTHLNLDGCTHLTDKFLVEGVIRFCPNLTHLSLNCLDLLSDGGFTDAFNEYQKINAGGLIKVSLVNCNQLGDRAIFSLLKYSAGTLLELNLNSIYNISKDFLLQIFTEDNHPSKLAMKKKSEEFISSNLENSKELLYFENINFPLLTSLDIGFVRAVDDEVLERISTKCEKLGILEVFGNNRCTSKAKIRKNLLLIGLQSETI